jgi:glutathione synthase/RimK-type ligase-like ATP-grasp enzyme
LILASQESVNIPRAELLKTPDKQILIASSSLDEGSWRPVVDKLQYRGYDPIIYEADKVADGIIPLDVRVDGVSGMRVSYNGRPLELENIAAAWYRRPALFAEEQKDKAKQLTLDTERRKAQYPLWQTVPEQAWLSAPNKIQHAEHKLTQLIMAREVGFEIPDTVVANHWQTIQADLPEKIIYKPSFGMVYDEEGMKLVYTVPFDNTPDELPLHGNPFPGFWQPYLNKAREWRITVVGDDAFDAAIYTDESAKDDWRKHQIDPTVEFKHEPFPDEQKQQCFDYLGKLGLGYGAFDFVEDHDGKITFLECNANGQFGWLEDDLGLPISSAIAGRLIHIASQSR